MFQCSTLKQHGSSFFVCWVFLNGIYSVHCTYNNLINGIIISPDSQMSTMRRTSVNLFKNKGFFLFVKHISFFPQFCSYFQNSNDQTDIMHVVTFMREGRDFYFEQNVGVHRVAH